MGEIDRIVLRGTNWLGDAVLTIPAVRALREIYPESSICMIAPANLTGLWENEESVDRVIPIARPTRLREKAGLIRLLRRGRYDLGVLFPNSFESALWFFLGGVRSRLGFARCGRGMLLDRTVTPPPNGGHQVHHYLQLVGTLGDFQTEPVPSIRVPEDARRWARDALRNEVLDEGVPLIGINPGAAYGEAKCWPRERFAELIGMLRARLGARVVVAGSEGERSQAESLCSAARGAALNMAGRTTLMQLAALAERCDAFVSNDTGPMHVAGAVGTPVVAIFGPTDPEATGPLGERVIVRSEADCAPCRKRQCPTDHRCMRLISAGEVFQAVQFLLKKNLNSESVDV